MAKALYSYDIEMSLNEKLNDKNRKSVYINIESGTYIRYSIKKEVWFMYSLKDKEKVKSKVPLPNDLKIISNQELKNKKGSIYSNLDIEP